MLWNSTSVYHLSAPSSGYVLLKSIMCFLHIHLALHSYLVSPPISKKPVSTLLELEHASFITSTGSTAWPPASLHQVIKTHFILSYLCWCLKVSTPNTHTHIHTCGCSPSFTIILQFCHLQESAKYRDNWLTPPHGFIISCTLLPIMRQPLLDSAHERLNNAFALDSPFFSLPVQSSQWAKRLAAFSSRLFAFNGIVATKLRILLEILPEDIIYTWGFIYTAHTKHLFPACRLCSTLASC